MNAQRVKVVTGLATAALSAAASAQVEGTATWLWDVTTENGDAIVEPGETATITLSVDMSPDVNFPDGPVLGFGGAVFDTLGGMNADKGMIVDWFIHDPFDEIMGGGDLTTTDGVSLFGTAVGQNPVIDNFSPADPIGVLTLTWSPNECDTFDVAYATNTTLMGIWVGSYPFDYDNDFGWMVVEAEMMFQVVPAPAGALLLLGSAFVIPRRRARAALQDRGAGRCASTPLRGRLPIITCASVLLLPMEVSAQSGHVEIGEYGTFAGPTQTDVIDETNIFVNLPPDCFIAVSPPWVVPIVNDVVTALDRNDAFAKTEALIEDWFDGAADPRVIWDPRNHEDDPEESQFVASTQGAKVAYAQEDTVTPFDDSAWYTSTGTAFDSGFDCTAGTGCEDGDAEDEGLVIDQPTLGYDHRAWYVSAPAVSWPGGGGADRLTNFFYIVTKKTDGDDTTIVRVHANQFTSNSGAPLCCFLKDGIPGDEGREVAYAAIHDTSVAEPPAAYFCGIAAEPKYSIPQTCPTSQFKALRIFAIGDPLDDDPADGDRELRFFDLPVPCFDPETINVPTGTETGTTGGGDGRMTGAFWHYLDEGLLYVVHSVNKPVLLGSAIHDQKVIRWYIIETNGWPDGATNPSIRDSGEINAGTTLDAEDNPFPVHLICPAITANESGDVAIVACKTSITHPLTIVATGRFEGTDAGEMFDLYDVKPSDSTRQPSPNRWGDYSGVAPDPADGETFWGFGEYMASNHQ